MRSKDGIYLKQYLGWPDQPAENIELEIHNLKKIEFPTIKTLRARKSHLNRAVKTSRGINA